MAFLFFECIIGNACGCLSFEIAMMKDMPYDPSHEEVTTRLSWKPKPNRKPRFFLQKPTQTDRQETFWNRNNTTSQPQNVTPIIITFNNNFIAITNANKIIAISIITAKLHIVQCFYTVGWNLEEHPACKTLSNEVPAWLSLYGARYRWFAHVPADATATPSTSLASLKSRIVSPTFLVPAYPGCPGWLSRV